MKRQVSRQSKSQSLADESITTASPSANAATAKSPFTSPHQPMPSALYKETADLFRKQSGRDILVEPVVSPRATIGESARGQKDDWDNAKNAVRKERIE